MHSASLLSGPRTMLFPLSGITLSISSHAERLLSLRDSLQAALPDYLFPEGQTSCHVLPQNTGLMRLWAVCTCSPLYCESLRTWAMLGVFNECSAKWAVKGAPCEWQHRFGTCHLPEVCWITWKWVFQRWWWFEQKPWLCTCYKWITEMWKENSQFIRPEIWLLAGTGLKAPLTSVFSWFTILLSFSGDKRSKSCFWGLCLLHKHTVFIPFLSLGTS